MGQYAPDVLCIQSLSLVVGLSRWHWTSVCGDYWWPHVCVWGKKYV